MLHDAGHDQRLHVGGPRRVQVGPGGDADELVRVLPRAFTRIPTSAATRSGSSSTPRAGSNSPSLAARISVVSYSDHKEDALNTSSGSRSPTVQQKWWEIGGYSALRKRWSQAPGFPEERSVRAGIPEIDGDRQGLLGRTALTPNCCSTCRSGFMTTSSPTRGPLRRRSICSSRIGRRSSRKKARSTNHRTCHAGPVSPAWRKGSSLSGF